MQKWADDEIKTFAREAINALNRKFHFGLEFIDAWVFSNSCGTNLHIQFRDADGAWFDITQNGGLLQADKKIGADVVGNIPEKLPDKPKIILRIAYFIHLKYLKEKEARKHG